MAEGIRIVPKPELDWIPGDATICVTDLLRPTPPPADGQKLEDIKPRCRACGKQHFAKTYLIYMQRGSALVSTEVWANLKNLPDNPFEYANPVPEPPGQRIHPLAAGKAQLVLPAGTVLLQVRPEIKCPSDAVVCIEDPSRPTPPPTDGQRLEDIKPHCRVCGKQHFAKTYQLQLQDRMVQVTDEVWANLQGIAHNPFERVGEVAPQPQIITLPSTSVKDNGRPELIEKSYVQPITTPRSA